MMKNNLDNAIIDFYSQNRVIKDVYKSFRKTKEFILLNNEFQHDLFKIFDLFSDKMKTKKLNKLYINVTDSNSLFFRFSSYKNNYEFKLEIFFEYNMKDDSDIESILHIYNNSQKISSQFGTAEYLFNSIEKLIPADFEKTYGSIDTKNPLRNNENFSQKKSKFISQTFNSYREESNNSQYSFQRGAAFS